MQRLNSYWENLWQASQNTEVETADSQTIRLHHDLTQPAVVSGESNIWLPSPAKGVKRQLLERDGGEKTLRATSIVAYAPNSYFNAHTHPLGEEFFVLHGTFSDEHGDYPAGSYVRNPPGSSHKPHSSEGCLIYVKLQQFRENDATQLALTEINNSSQKAILFDDYEKVELIEIAQQQELSFWQHNGVELLLLEGNLNSNQATLSTGDWQRLPANHSVTLIANQNSKLLLKTGHLNNA
ncbi:MAG: hypothetical protein GJ680_09175 [Alteromonadaceae bacterium]|nr:hypothetical protein [Alteromonadaceae bacterium]